MVTQLSLSFDSLAPSSYFENWLAYYDRVAENGFIIDDLERVGLEAMSFLPPSESKWGYYYNGAGVLTQPSSDLMELRHRDGSNFTVYSVELDTSFSAAMTIQFTGCKSDGMVVQDFALDTTK